MKNTLILFSIFLIVHFNISAQKVEPCGLLGNAFAQQFNDGFQSYQNKILSLNKSIFNLPLQIWVVTDDLGANEFQMNQTFFEEMLDYANNSFANINFYVCNIDTIKSTQYQEVRVGFAPTSDIIGLTGTAWSNEAINIYLLKGIKDLGDGRYAGWASFPNTNDLPQVNYVLLSDEVAFSKSLLAHELGHHFGLLYTHAPYDANGLPPVSPSILTGGDNISDTPVDPGPTRCVATCNNFCPNITANDGNTYNYTPLHNNLMSYYWNCHNTMGFTNEQNARILFSLNFFSNRSKLMSISPTCDGIDFDKVNGLVERVRFNSTINDWEYNEFSNAPIDMFQNGNIVCSKVTNTNGEYSPNCSFSSNLLDVVPRKEYNSNVEYSYMNGVSTFDIVLIQKHILGTKELPLPYYWIAADVDMSGSITSADVTKIRNIILNTETSWESGSWRFLPKFMFHRAFGTTRLFEQNDPFEVAWLGAFGGNRQFLATSSTKAYLDESRLRPDWVHSIIPSTWSFTAIKMGDVNGSAVVTRTKNNKINEEVESRNDEIKIISNVSCIKKNQVIWLYINPNLDKPIVAFQLGIAYDSNKISIKKIMRGRFNDRDDFDGFSHSEEEDKGILRVIWINKTTRNRNFTVNDNWLAIQISAKDDICEFTSVFNLDNNILENKFWEESGEELGGEITLTNTPSRENLGISTVNNLGINAYPNPSTGWVAISINSYEHTNAIIRLVDQLGNRIEKKIELEVGENIIEFETSSLKLGILIYSVESGSTIESGRVIKLY